MTEKKPLTEKEKAEKLEKTISVMAVYDEEQEEILLSQKKVKELVKKNKTDELSKQAEQALKEYNMQDVMKMTKDPLIDSFDIIDED